MVTALSRKKELRYSGKILVVDDAPSVVELVSEILKPRYLVKTASSGEEALEVLKEFKPDLILLDVVMKEMSGYEVCRKIRSNPISGFTKVIMVSGKKSLNERLKGYEAGADDYLCKPFESEELRAKVSVFLRLKSVEDEIYEINTRLNEQVNKRTIQLIDAEKMAEIGKYAAGIVHNLNNPLQAIISNAQLIEMENPDNRYAKSVREAAIIMKEMIATILIDSSKKSRQEVVDIDFNRMLQNQVEIQKANRFFKQYILVEMDLKPLPSYQGVYSHFSQSLGNLLKNAVDAMHETEKKILRISTSVDRETIKIEVSDTGQGILKEDLENIFDPFFTTKPITADEGCPTGTGLGLASSKEMIESYEGKILVDSELGEGSRFTVLLPLKDKT